MWILRLMPSLAVMWDVTHSVIRLAQAQKAGNSTTGHPTTTTQRVFLKELQCLNLPQRLLQKKAETPKGKQDMQCTFDA